MDNLFCIMRIITRQVFWFFGFLVSKRIYTTNQERKQNNQARRQTKKTAQAQAQRTSNYPNDNFDKIQ